MLKPSKLLIVALLLVATSYDSLRCDQPPDVITSLVRSTFKIQGLSQDKKHTEAGSVFVLLVPDAANPRIGRVIMITAAHVLQGISGDSATLILRKEVPNSGFVRVPYSLRIRDKNGPLWVQHEDPSIDVAAMNLTLPNEYFNFGIPPISMLMDDSDFKRLEIHPGDELLCLGFPLGCEANEGGFPILRSGKIASYPLMPASKVKGFFFDFTVLNGNSGGPVFLLFRDRQYGDTVHLGETVFGIVGIVRSKALSPPGVPEQPVFLGYVVPAQFIRETVERLLKSSGGH